MTAKRLLIILLCLGLLCPVQSPACTVFYASRNGLTLAGGNEDWVEPEAYLWCLPAESDKFGRMYLGFSTQVPQAGLNDQGLFFDFTAVAYRPLDLSRKREAGPRFLVELILEQCATVDQALALLQKYNFPALCRSQLILGDVLGKSVIVEGDTVIARESDFQAATNFRQAERPEKPYPCKRYEIARTMLEQSEISVDRFRSILAATHQEEGWPTQYSYVFDLKAGEIWLYHFHNYTETVRLNLREELKKGARASRLRGLFPQPVYAAQQYYQEHAPRERTAIKADPALFQSLAGCYRILPEVELTVSTSSGRLFGQLSGMNEWELFPESGQNYFFRAIDMQVSFAGENAGKADSVKLIYLGEEMTGKRIGD